jgi:hypothetical protein
MIALVGSMGPISGLKSADASTYVTLVASVGVCAECTVQQELATPYEEERLIIIIKRHASFSAEEHSCRIDFGGRTFVSN